MLEQPIALDRRRNAASQAYGYLREWIIIGRLRPGEAISEPMMAEWFGVSRTPIREVFKRLDDEGLLDIFPQVGTVVAPIDLEAVRDSQFIRETIESRTIELAAASAAAADIARLNENLERQEDFVQARDHRSFFVADDELHETLMRMSGHAGAWRTIKDIKSQLDRVRYLSLEDRSWLGMVFDEHREIVRAVARRDVEGAKAAMQAHLRTVFAAIERIAPRHPDFFKTASEIRPIAPKPARKRSS